MDTVDNAITKPVHRLGSEKTMYDPAAAGTDRMPFRASLWTTVVDHRGFSKSCGLEVFDLRREIRVWLGN
jgi:hypothetical protein